jgi:hypothetical protein
MTTDITTRIRHDMFRAIRYEKRGKKGAMIGVQLGPHFVFKWLVQESWDHFAASIPTASRCKFLSSEDLFNDAQRWARLPNGVALYSLPPLLKQSFSQSNAIDEWNITHATVLPSHDQHAPPRRVNPYYPISKPFSISTLSTQDRSTVPSRISINCFFSKSFFALALA